MNEKDLVLFTITVSGLLFYGAFLPSVSEVALSYQTPDEKKVIRESEIMGSTLLVTISAVTAIASKSGTPLLVGVCVAIAILGAYEYALARVPIDKDF